MLFQHLSDTTPPPPPPPHGLEQNQLKRHCKHALRIYLYYCTTYRQRYAPIILLCMRKLHCLHVACSNPSSSLRRKGKKISSTPSDLKLIADQVVDSVLVCPVSHSSSPVFHRRDWQFLGCVWEGGGGGWGRKPFKQKYKTKLEFLEQWGEGLRRNLIFGGYGILHNF